MKKRNLLICMGLCALFLFSLGSCKKKSVQTTTDYTDYQNIELEEPDTEIPVLKSKSDVTYRDLFNLGNRISITVDISEAELAKLEADYEVYKESGYEKIKTYRRADKVTITLTNYQNTFTWEFEDVGIRQKGNTSRNYILDENGNLNINHFKLSFDETFDDDSYGDDKIDWSGRDKERKERQKRDFLGLSGLDLKWNATSDESHIREIYASKMYQAAGLITQYIGLSTFTINRTDKNISDYMGVFLLYEPASKSMIKRHLKNENILDFDSWSEEKNGSYGCADSSYGDLYRMGWSADLSISTMYGDRIGYGSEDGTYSPLYDCKTNEGTSYDHNLLKQLGYSVEYGNYANISEHLDTTYFAATEAVSWLIGNPDDLRDDQNNTMVYMRRKDGKGITIPVDNDRCLGITRWWNPDGTGMTAKGIFDTARGADGSDVFPIYTKTILSDENNYSKTVYLNYIKAFAVSRWCDGSCFDEFYDVARKTYGEYTSCSHYYVGFDKDSIEYNDYTFDTYIKKKLENVDLTLDLGEIAEVKKEDIGQYENLAGYYGSLYICGSFNDWKGTEYPFSYLGDGIYEITFSPQVNGTIWYKIYDGSAWYINWSIVNGTLIMHDMDAQTISGLSSSSVVTITIDTINKMGSISIK